MKNLLLPLLFLLFFVDGYALNAEVYYQREGHKTMVYARNLEFYPVTARLTLDLTNMAFSGSPTGLQVIPANTNDYRLGELTVVRKGEVSRFSLSADFVMGDLINTKLKDYVYDLPFAKGKTCKLFQGYNGKFSHQNENSLDFMMPEGSDVLAAREGRVVEVVQSNNQSCPSEECKKYNNYITILHEDGTFARYAHLQFNGAKVKLGDFVKKGDVIALSGSTGWTTGPHLHFVCFTSSFGRQNTLSTWFRINTGKQIEVPKEGTSYRRNY